MNLTGEYMRQYMRPEGKRVLVIRICKREDYIKMGLK